MKAQALLYRTTLAFLGNERVTLSEFQGIFLPCTEMTMDAVTELFNLFASEPAQLDPLEYGSGLSEIDKEAFSILRIF